MMTPDPTPSPVKYPLLTALSAIQLLHGDKAVKQAFEAMTPQVQQQVRQEIAAFKQEVLSRIIDMTASFN